jgi:hypothetical protein
VGPGGWDEGENKKYEDGCERSNLGENLDDENRIFYFE